VDLDKDSFEEGEVMSGKTDEAKGRAKKAAGELAEDPGLKNRGRTDRAKGKVKKGADEVAKQTKRGIKKVS
jgi:uncharacterized protein YjbJ (UPF0337 family)